MVSTLTGRRRPRRPPPARSGRGGRRRRPAAPAGRRPRAARRPARPGRGGRRSRAAPRCGCRRTVSGRNCRISDRDSSGATTENDGFSVVAATSSTTRFSTAESSASCWVLENRCTSSMNSTVCSPARQRAVAPVDDGPDVLDACRQRRQRLEPAAGRACEISAASVVLPLPGGPYRMTDATPEPSTRRRSGDPGASKWSCPTTSSSDAGRIRTASGAPADTPRPWWVVCRCAGKVKETVGHGFRHTTSG